ncbi:hypothetical protein RHMOL_Rhmol09G0013100 [Rhododendron molle]|uniref:Uncharacterized protein n=1 Tax=Rhododendron molle TaxID=49168 RepID=A0ACC0M9N3_RHOML|nr:hypothetical protein RHMOL_Rhmol09G0013100 [Rhododendron molle]
MRLPHDSSWTIRKLFKLREEVQPLIKYVIGNGNTTFLWLDNWHAAGPLYNLFGEDIVHNVGSSLLAKVSSIIQNGDWHWPRQRNRAIMQIMRSTPATLRPYIAVEDSVTWLPAPNGIFSVKTAWEALRNPLPKVPRAHVVWLKQGIPRWAFIMWLVCWGRLSTKDRLLSWGMRVDPLCVFCHNVHESHEHLFFHCSFSACIWGRILFLFGMSRSPGEWEQEIHWAVQHLKKKGFSSALYKLALAGTVYYVWKARNDSIFSNKQYIPEIIFEQIVMDVRDRVFSWRNCGCSPVNRILCRAWNISEKIL